MEPQDNSQTAQPASAVPPPLSLSSSPESLQKDGGEPNHQEPRSSPLSASSNSRSNVPLERDLTNRLVGVIIWFSLATSAGCVMEMAETKAPPNVAGAMKLGLVAAIACAYKDLEKSRMPLSLLRAPQKFFSKLIVRLDSHSVQLEENTVGQVQLEEKIDALTHRVDTLTLAMVRPPSLNNSQSVQLPANAAPATPASNANQTVPLNGYGPVNNGQLHNGGLNSNKLNSHELGEFNNGRPKRSLGPGFS